MKKRIRKKKAKQQMITYSNAIDVVRELISKLAKTIKNDPVKFRKVVAESELSPKDKAYWIMVSYQTQSSKEGASK